MTRDIDSIGGDERFKDMVWEILQLHARKQADYGTDVDPFANVRASADFGIPAWIGVGIRMQDKMKRLQTMSKKGLLHNESLLDSFMDLAVYGAIGAVLVKELDDGQSPSAS